MPAAASVPYENVLPLQGGSIGAGIALCLTVSCLSQYGLSFNIFKDRQRQKFVNFLCLIGALAGSSLLFSL